MQREHVIAILLALAGVPAGIALMAAPLYFQAPPWMIAAGFWGGLVLALGMYGAALVLVLRENFGPAWRAAVWLFTGAGLMAMILYIFVMRQTGFDVDQSFASAFGTYKEQLGATTSAANNAHDANGRTRGYQGEYNNGIIIWLDHIYKIYVMPYNDRVNSNKWFSQNTSGIDETWCNEDYVRRQIRGLRRPPICNVARHWASDPKKWSPLGENRWDCYLSENLKFQHFKNGMILGVFRRTELDDAGVVFVLFDDGTWAFHPSDATASKCIRTRDR
jgi:hypothetical protein